MGGRHFWTTVLAINSFFWFIALGVTAYGFGMMIVALDWKKFVLGISFLIALSLSELVFAGIAHE